MSEIRVIFNRFEGKDGDVHAYLHYQRFTLCRQRNTEIWKAETSEHPDCKLCRAVLYQILIDKVDYAFGWRYTEDHYLEEAAS